MNLFAMIFIVSICGAIIGVKKPWMGGIPGLLTGPYLYYFSTSLDIVFLIISVLSLSLLGSAYSFLSSIIFSGLKGGGHSVGSIYIMGFGAHHPGGIIREDDERKGQNKNIKHEIFISY